MPWYIFLLFLLTLNNSCAGDNVISSCAVTPDIYIDYDMPEAFSRSNSLVRQPDSIYGAKGTVIILEGRVLDINCVPVVNATVRIWQLNSLGFDKRNVDDPQYFFESNYGNNLIRPSSPMKIISLYDPNFSGTGTAVTDNLGYYKFITVLPGADRGRAPHINFSVTHQDYLPLSTVMFFEDIALVNTKTKERVSYLNDPVATKYPRSLIKLLAAKLSSDKDNSRTYKFDITLSGAHPYRKYRQQ